MGLKSNLQTFFRNIWGIQEGQFTTRDPEKGAFGFLGNSTASGKSVGPNDPLQHANYLRGIMTKALVIGYLPMQVFEETTNDKGETTKKKNPRSDLQRLLDYPNDYSSGRNFRTAMQYQCEKYGNAYAEIRFGGNGKAAEMHVLQAPNMSVKVSNDGRGFYYEYNQGGKITKFQPREIFHIKGLSEDSITGLATYQLCSETMGNALATNEHSSSYFKNNAKPSDKITFPAGVDKINADEFKTKYNEEFGSSKNAHKTLFLSNGIVHEPISNNPEESQLSDLKELNAYEMATLSGTPAHLCGLMARATFSNIEQQHQEFIDFTLMPLAKAWEDEIVLKLVGRNNYSTYAKFNFGSLLRGDNPSRGMFLSQMVQNGIYTINEARAFEDKEPIEGGDKPLVNGTLKSLDAAINPPEPPAIQAPPNADPAKPEEKKPDDEEPEAPVLEEKK